MPGLRVVSDFMRDYFALIKSLPLSLKPRYFCLVIEKIYAAAISKITQV